MTRRKVPTRTIDAVRNVPLSVTLQALQEGGQLNFKVDPTFHPRADASTRRVHVSLQSGRVLEVLLTGIKWFNVTQNVGGGGSIDLAIHLLDCSFKAAVLCLAEHALPLDPCSTKES